MGLERGDEFDDLHHVVFLRRAPREVLETLKNLLLRHAIRLILLLTADVVHVMPPGAEIRDAGCQLLHTRVLLRGSLSDVLCLVVFKVLMNKRHSECGGFL